MLPFPNRSDAMVWQAETGFAFRMANGYVSSAAPPGVPEPRLVRTLQRPTPPTSRQPFVRWARREGVTTVVAFGPHAAGWGRLLAPTERAHSVDGVYLYDLRPNGRGGCGS
jgi:hypothetical protein